MKDAKAVGTAVVAAAMTFLGVTCGYQGLTNRQSTTGLVVVDAQGEALPGHLVVLDLSKSRADSFVIKVTPDTADYKLMDKLIVFTALEGAYTVNIVGVRGGEVEMIDYPIVVSNSAKPDRPAPITPVAPVSPESESVESFIKALADTSQLDKDDAKLLSVSFTAVAEMIQPQASVQEIISATASSNRSILGGRVEACRPFLDMLNKKLKVMHGTGELVTPADHQRVWREIAQGLKDFAS